MAKGCIKINLQNVGNEMDDLIKMEDSAHGTLCAIHKTIHSNSNFPRSNHTMLKLCPVAKQCSNSSTKVPNSIRSRRKIRSNSNSASSDGAKICRVQSASSARQCPLKPHIYCKIEKTSGSPNFCSTNYVNVEKTISCPEKMCCYNSNTSTNKTCTFTSRSSIQIDQFAQNLLSTDEVVNELKGEIEKVKHQLHHISEQKMTEGIKKTKIPCLIKQQPSPREENAESSAAKFKNEIKKLKRENEAKKKLLEKSKNEVSRVKDILADYEKKVHLLHLQAVKSSKVMKISKDKFCACLKEKDEKIKRLTESNDMMKRTVIEKETFLSQKEKEIQLLTENIDSMKSAFDDASDKCLKLGETNKNFLDSFDMLRNQLQNSTSEIESQRETIHDLEQKLCDLNCICKKVISKAKKQKESYEQIVKNHTEERTKLSNKVSEMSSKIEQAEQQKNSFHELQCKYEKMHEKIQEYEVFSEKCKALEEECKKQQDELEKSRTNFEKDKKEMEKLIDELTTVVKENKVSILQMTEINKQQELIIKSQSMALLTKEEQLSLMETESQNFKIKNEYLEHEIQELRKTLSEPCSKEACLCISKELSTIKNALNVEKDTQLLKEKIIEDQSQTIINLQSQVKEKMLELSNAQNDTKYLEQEIGKINEKLIKKHQELDMEIDEKENLIEKLRILECQKNQLSEEINDFEGMLHEFQETCGNENQQNILRNLEEQIYEQKRQWDMQKDSLAKEKQKAVCAAKFATQKLLDTVADFQRQVGAQKKVQFILTKMLHEKDEQLRAVKSKIININSITKEEACEEKALSMKELYFRDGVSKGVSSHKTNTSLYSSCSSCCQRPECIAKHIKIPKTSSIFAINNPKASLRLSENIQGLAKILSSDITEQEEPIRDMTY